MTSVLLDTDILSEIAAIAIRASLPVATGNVAHFEFVRSLGYEASIDNWRS